MASEQEPPHISMKEAVKLARWKPAKNQTRKDLLVYGGWLTSRWEWSRDTDVSLDQAIANSRRLGEDVRIVGNPKPADRMKVRGRKPQAAVFEETELRVTQRPPALPIVSELPPPLEEPMSPADEVGETPAVEELQDGADLEAPEPPAVSVVSPPPEPSLEKTAVPPPQGSRLLLERFLVASGLCSMALFLGYFGLAGSLYVFILLMADAFFIVGTSVLALRNRRGLGGMGRGSPVKAQDVTPGN